MLLLWGNGVYREVCRRDVPSCTVWVPEVQLWVGITWGIQVYVYWDIRVYREVYRRDVPSCTIRGTEGKVMYWDNLGILVHHRYTGRSTGGKQFISRVSYAQMCFISKSQYLHIMSTQVQNYQFFKKYLNQSHKLYHKYCSYTKQYSLKDLNRVTKETHLNKSCLRHL